MNEECFWSAEDPERA